MEKLYEGKAKIIYTTEDPEMLISYFKDDATAFNAQKKGQIHNKGEMNCSISSALFQRLESVGIATHYIGQPQANQMLIRSVKIIPLEVVVRNVAAGNLCKQTGIAEGTFISPPLVEFYLKNDELGDPLLTSDRLRLLNLATPEEVTTLQSLALQINQHLQEFLDSCDILLVDFKLEFGRDSSGRILVADEISPDTCRFWDKNQSDPKARIMDKDRFRKDLGNVEDAYMQVKQRVSDQMALS